MARKPTPTAQKKIAGNPGKRPLNKNEPIIKSRGTLDKPPAHVKGAARKMWQYLLKTLPKGVLTGADVVQLEVYCNAYALYTAAVERVNAEGSVVLSPEKGVPMQNPWASIVNRQAEIMMRSGSSLGLDPSSRSKLQIQEEPENNPFDEI